MPSPSSPRWLRFSLRALLVIITLLCIWLARETQIVRTRKKLREAAAGKVVFQTAREFEMMPIMYAIGVEPPPTAKIFFVREWLGDEAIQGIWICHPENRELGEKLRRAFPEATLDDERLMVPVE